ncbi:MAG: co-chaperone GroES [Myxococcota bacterium]
MSQKTLRPLHDRVLVRRIEEEEKVGSLFIPDSAKEKPLEGEVIAVGEGRTMDNGQVRKVCVKPGDRVLFAKYAETEVKVGDQTHLLLREDDILGLWG